MGPLDAIIIINNTILIAGSGLQIIFLSRKDMSDQVSILVGQNRNDDRRFFYFLKQRFLIIIYLLSGKDYSPDITSDQRQDFIGPRPILTRHCPMTDSYLQLCRVHNYSQRPLTSLWPYIPPPP